MKFKKEELMNKFLKTLLETNRNFSFFVDWNKVDELSKYNKELEIINGLVGSKNIKEDFYNILSAHPYVIRVFPLLLAISKKERKEFDNGNALTIFNNFEMLKKTVETYYFDQNKNIKNNDQNWIDDYYLFFEKTGLKTLFTDIIKFNIYDYAVGVMVGLDTNARKNRSGKLFQNLCSPYLKNICNRNGIELLEQKKFSILNKKIINNKETNLELGYLEEKIADFILIKNGKIMNIEVNFYNSSGSKPEAIVGSYINRKNELNKQNIGFILITDGDVWSPKDKNQLHNAFENLSVYNLFMTHSGYLEEELKEFFK